MDAFGLYFAFQCRRLVLISVKCEECRTLWPEFSKCWRDQSPTFVPQWHPCVTWGL